MSEQNKLNISLEVEEHQKQRGLWIAGIFTAVSAIFMVISAYAAVVVQQGRFELEDIILMPTTFILTIASLLSYFWMRQGRYQAGSELLFFAMMMTPVMATLVLSNILWIALAFTAIFFWGMYSLVLVKSSKPLALGAIALVILIFSGIEIWNPAFRGISDVAVKVTPFVIVLAAIAFLALIVYQAWDKIVGSIINRLTALVLVVSIPLLIGVTVYISSRAGNEIQTQALHALEDHNQSLSSNISVWLEQHVQTIKEMSMLPDIVSMDPARQKPTLKVVANAHPNLFLVHTIGLDGINIARNDDADLINYSDRVWFLRAKEGDPIAFDVVISRTIGKPVLAISAPIYDQSEIVGVASIITELTEISEELLDVESRRGITYVVDTNNRVVAHPDPAYTEGALQDLSTYPPVAALREGVTGKFTFTDENGVAWVAYLTRLENGWGIISQQSEAELLAPVRQFQTTSTILIVIGSTILFALAWFVIRRSLQPIGVLTTTASAIAAGELNRVAEVGGRDEIGVLASAFNNMTTQLRDFIASLESRVAERTRNLELAAKVGRTVSQVRALDVMLKDAAELIRAQFALYYVQVYLVNPAQTHLVLAAGTGEAGTALLARKHQLPLNTGSINGRAAVERRPEVISDTSKSAVFKPNPLLPETRSEMAVPLMIGDRVVGVLDMQSKQAGSLNQDILPAFEALAGQLAIAIQNANLLAEAEQARAEVEAQSRRLARAGWQEYLDALHKPEQTGFVFEQNQILPLESETTTEPPEALTAPISFAEEQIGSLVVEVEPERQTPQTMELVNIVARQVAQQIENLRLLESAERYRFEAEQAARRLTREGWEVYLSAKADQSLGYLYDLKQVKPYDPAQAISTESALNIPIKVRDEIIGNLAVLDLDTADPETFELVHTVSERLSEHLESLRLLEETQRGQVELNKRAQKLAAVSEISTISSRETDVNRMLETVVHLTQRKFGLYHAHVFTYDPNHRQLSIVACGWKEGDEHEGTHGTTTIPLDAEQSLVARAARTRQPVVVNDVRSDPGWLPNPLLPDTQSELAVPLVIGDEILGVLDVQSDHYNAFSEEDVNIQMTLAAQVATALQNARNYERARRQAEREAMLNAISQKIQSATSVEAVLQIAARELGHALGAPRTIAQLSMKDQN